MEENKIIANKQYTVTKEEVINKVKELFNKYKLEIEESKKLNKFDIKNFSNLYYSYSKKLNKYIFDTLIGLDYDSIENHKPIDNCDSLYYLIDSKKLNDEFSKEEIFAILELFNYSLDLLNNYIMPRKEFENYNFIEMPKKDVEQERGKKSIKNKLMLIEYFIPDKMYLPFYKGSKNEYDKSAMKLTFNIFNDKILISKILFKEKQTICEIVLDSVRYVDYYILHRNFDGYNAKDNIYVDFRKMHLLALYEILNEINSILNYRFEIRNIPHIMEIISNYSDIILNYIENCELNYNEIKMIFDVILKIKKHSEFANEKSTLECIYKLYNKIVSNTESDNISLINRYVKYIAHNVIADCNRIMQDIEML